MKHLIFAHNHTIAPAALPHVRALARQLRLQGNQVCVLVADPALNNQLALHDLAQNPIEADEFAYPTVSNGSSSLEEGNQVLLFEVLPSFLDWFKPDSILMVDPALLGWNTMRCVHKTLPKAEMKALVTICADYTSTQGAWEHNQIQSTLLDGALRLFKSVDVYSSCIDKFTGIYGHSLAGKPHAVEAMT